MAQFGHLDVGDAWPLRLGVTDPETGNVLSPPAVTVTVRVTLPDGTTTADPTVTYDADDQEFEASHTLTVPGRHTGKWTVSGDVIGVHHVSIFADAAALTLPTEAQVRAFLGDSAAQWTVPQLQEVLDAEIAAQAAVCRVKAVYPNDLRMALFRRVQRALAMRALPLGFAQGDAGATFLPGRDPEVRRLEGPYRKLVVA